MSISFSDNNIYPGHDHSLSQLLCAAKRKLQDATFGLRIATSVNKVIALERDALEVLGLIRSLRHTFAPIHRIPPDVLSLVPDYYCEDDEVDRDKYLVTLTHVCRDWRDIFLSRSSLWTELHCMDVDKTRTYIQRSQTSPLDVYLDNTEDDSYLNDAFSLVIPHICRLRSLNIFSTLALPDVLSHFYSHMPLLERLDIVKVGARAVLDSRLLNGDLSSLRELSLDGLSTHLPWRKLANLRVVELVDCTLGHDVNQLLDFFESTPLLHTIVLRSPWTPDLSDVPPERTVSLPYLNTLDVDADSTNTLLLNYLCIPTGASLTLALCFYSKIDSFPLLDHLSERSCNIRNLTLIRRLSVWGYKHPRSTQINNCPVFQTLSTTKNLRTLTLIACSNHLPFITALNPEEGPSNIVQCPDLENLSLEIGLRDQFDVGRLISMAKNRASRGVRLWSITIVCLDRSMSGAEMLELGEHVTHVEYRVVGASPTWYGMDT